MTESEVAQLLAVAATFDRFMVVDELTVKAWREVLGDIEYVQAQKAVLAHFRSSSKPIMPADVRSGAKPDPNAWMARTERAPWQMTPEERLEKFGRAWDDATLQLARSRGLTEDAL
ncbi:hypothetical protein LLS1_18750 [Leifsonia sp. LS1]|nr:hypothetical protein LLS1_18750 [Leifsonia sp. LS1]